MPLPVIADVFRVAINWQLTGAVGNAVTVMHFLDQLGTQDAFALAVDLNADANANMFNMMDANVDATNCDIIPLDGSTAGSNHDLTTWSGTGTADNVPAQAVLVSLKTGLRGPSRRGRMFLPFPTESNNANGLIDETFRAALETGWETFLADMASDNWTWVVASYAHAYATEITQVQVDNALATQRRRQDRIRRAT